MVILAKNNFPNSPDNFRSISTRQQACSPMEDNCSRIVNLAIWLDGDMPTFKLHGDTTTKPKRPNFSPEFRLESAQFVVDQGYKVLEATEAICVGKSSMSRWVRQHLPKLDTVFRIPQDL